MWSDPSTGFETRLTKSCYSLHICRPSTRQAFVPAFRPEVAFPSRGRHRPAIGFEEGRRAMWCYPAGCEGGPRALRQTASKQGCKLGSEYSCSFSFLSSAFARRKETVLKSGLFPCSCSRLLRMALLKTRKEVRASCARSLLHVSFSEFSQDSEQTTTCRKQMLWRGATEWRGGGGGDARRVPRGKEEGSRKRLRPQALSAGHGRWRPRQARPSRARPGDITTESTGPRGGLSRFFDMRLTFG